MTGYALPRLCLRAGVVVLALGLTSALAQQVKVSQMLKALTSPGPSAEISKLDCPYGWLIGGWHARVVDYRDGGSPIVSEGEWHFSWVLEGRAVQDVWIAPVRGQRSSIPPEFPNRYGTSIRSYDYQRRQWRVTWINPISGAYDVLWARRAGADIVHEGIDNQGRRMRWVFTDIRADSARWYGERSADDGETWKLEAEFFLKRR